MLLVEEHVALEDCQLLTGNGDRIDGNQRFYWRYPEMLHQMTIGGDWQKALMDNGHRDKD